MSESNPRHLDVGGARLAYETHGADDAPPLVLAHSIGTDRHLWDPQVEALAERFRVVRYDVRGHGASSGTAPGFTVVKQKRPSASVATRP